MLTPEDIGEAFRTVMAEQPDGAGIANYWSERGVPFAALEALATGFASSSVRSIGRAARDKERVEALVRTAVKVGLAGGWELHDRAALTQAFAAQGDSGSDPDVAFTTPVEAAILRLSNDGEKWARYWRALSDD